MSLHAKISFMCVLEAHILLACMTQFKMKSLDGIPSTDIAPKKFSPDNSV